MSGGIRKRANGLYEGRVRLGSKLTRDGKRVPIRKSVYGKTRRAVERQLAELKADKASGRVVAPQNLTLRSAFERWVIRPGLKPRTIETYRENIAYLDSIADLPIQRLTPQHVEDVLFEMSAKRRAHSVHALLKRILTRAEDQDLIRRSPLRGVPRPIYRPSRREPLSAQEQSQLQRHVQQHPTLAGDLLLAGMGTGCRLGELLALRVGDVDWKSDRFRVEQSLTETTKGEFAFGRPKTEAARRAVWIIDSPTRQAFRRRRRAALRRPEEGRALADRLLFATSAGSPLGRSNLSRDAKSLLQTAKLREVRGPFHTMRHTFANNLSGRHVPIAVAARLLGHESPATTIGVYQNPSEDDLETALVEAFPS